MNKVLLLSQTFCGMWRGYANGFASAGLNVVSRLYDQRSSPRDLASHIWKVYGHKVRYGSTPLDVLRLRFLAKTLRALAEESYDIVVLISGALIDSEVFAPVRSRGIPVVIWLDDQLERLGYREPAQLDQYDMVATFSRKDSEWLRSKGINAHYLPFGFDEHCAPTARKLTREVAFVGNRDDYRTRVLEELIACGLPVRAYGQQWSPSLMSRVRDLSWSRPDVPGRPRLSYGGAKRVYQESLASLNLHVGVQDLMNPRTFDIAGVGGVQIVDRPDVSEFYEPGKEVLVFESVEEICEHVRHAQCDPHWANGIRTAARRRTLADHTISARCREVVSWV